MNRSSPTTKYNIICFGFMPWSSQWKRNQSMMAELAKLEMVGKVIFVNPDLSLWHSIKQRFKGGGEKPGRFSRQRVNDNVWVYTPGHLLPKSYQSSIVEKSENRFHLRRLQEMNGDAPYILFMNCPNLLYPYPLDQLLQGAALSIFDLSDDFVELVHSAEGKRHYTRNIEQYVKQADVVLAVNDYLRAKYAYLNPDIHVVANATNYANFDRLAFESVAFLEPLKRKGGPIIGYSGICNISRMDLDLLRYLMANRPVWQFVFVGSKGEELLAQLPRYENLHQHPAVDYRLLPDCIAYFDVAIVPFQINDHTRGNDLLKFHDYLAMGKPVVTTNIGGAERLKSVLHIADTPKSFLQAIERALTDNGTEAVNHRKRVAEANAWPSRVKEVEMLIAGQLAQKCGGKVDQPRTFEGHEQA